ncbi:MAG TPA: hypothetical protein VGN82_01035 [Bosea sp. (in: a-proteobacteria)]|jgi:hypothetical protein|uniref:hypothetical protein n=1 Tax=Bosea sp. (in: a-proteobacteria) TaxID=1871050 RepID=UPI002E0EEA66|nr:hypothetical protein [Bosea sp. (in: a-proteobacteria)]
MTRFTLSLMLILAAGTAFAQARPSSPDRTCAANRQSVLANGAIVLGTGGYTFDRFVRDSSFCPHGDILDPAWIPSRDTPQCFVGYRCKTDMRWD